MCLSLRGCSAPIAARAAAAATAVDALYRTNREAGGNPAKLFHRAHGRREGTGGDVDDLAAAVAYGVVVWTAIRVEARRIAASAGEANDASQASARERVERIVNCGEAHSREGRTQALEEILRGRMRRIVREKTDDGDSLKSELQARGAQVVEHRPGSLPTAFHLEQRNENHSNRQPPSEGANQSRRLRAPSTDSLR